MLSIGHVHIRNEELASVSWNGRELTVGVVWPEEDLISLLQLDPEPLLRFEHLAPDDSGVPTRLAGWKAVRNRSTGTFCIALHLTLVATTQARISPDI